MIKILKDGVDTIGITYYRSECPICHCIFEFDETDLKDEGGIIFKKKTISCPYCHCRTDKYEEINKENNNDKFVLVRDNKKEKWQKKKVSHHDADGYPVTVETTYRIFAESIPYEGNEIKESTTEDIKDKFVPQNGDFVTYIHFDEKEQIHYKTITIYKKPCNNEAFIDDEVYIAYFVNSNSLSKCFMDKFISYSYIERRMASKEEKKLLLKKMKENKKYWNVKNKKIIGN